jgi:hypothetical protein
MNDSLGPIQLGEASLAPWDRRHARFDVIEQRAALGHEKA